MPRPAVHCPDIHGESGLDSFGGADVGWPTLPADRRAVASKAVSYTGHSSGRACHGNGSRFNYDADGAGGETPGERSGTSSGAVGGGESWCGVTARRCSASVHRRSTLLASAQATIAVAPVLPRRWLISLHRYDRVSL